LANKTTRSAKGGGTLRKRSDGRWEARYSLGFDPKTGKQIQRSVYGKTQKEVRQKLASITTEIDNGTYTEPSRMKVSDWLKEWLRDYIGNVKQSTVKSYTDHVNLNIIPYIGNVELSKLTTPMIQRMYNELLREKELSPKTVKNVHGVLHRALEQAQKMGFIRTNPTEAVTLPRIEKKQIKPLEDEELTAFLQAIKGHPYELVFFCDRVYRSKRGRGFGPHLGLCGF
jgi:integrase